jgi:hypothetical protein
MLRREFFGVWVAPREHGQSLHGRISHVAVAKSLSASSQKTA